MVTLNEAELDRLQALADAATPGPWTIEGDFIEPDIGEAWSFTGAANGEFIAAAREALPTLITEVRRLRAGIARAIHEDVTIPSSDQNKCFHGGWYTDGTPCYTEEYLTNLLDVERG